MAARKVPPLPPANVPMYLDNGTMSPIWTGFWTQLLLFLGDLTDFGDYVNDAAAAAAGVQVGQIYRSSNALKVRVV